MSWSYNFTLSAAKDKVRLLLGDTNTNDQILSNEEITFFLTEHGSNIYSAVAACAEAAAAKFLRDKDRSAVGMSSNLSDRYNRFLELAKKYKARAGISAELDVGGILESRRDTIRSNSDLIPHFAQRGRFRNNG